MNEGTVQHKDDIVGIDYTTVDFSLTTTESVAERTLRTSEYQPLAEERHIGHLDLTVMYPLYYLRAYSDLSNAYGPDGFWAARDHWRSHGRREGRSPTPFFDPQYYLSIHPDLQEAFGDDYKAATTHWVNNGIKEGRQGSRVFHLKYYYDAHPDLQSAYPNNDYLGAFGHWLRHGHKEGRRTTSHGPQLQFFQHDLTFGTVLDQPHFFGRKREERLLVCGIGYTLCVFHTTIAPDDDDRCKKIIKACGEGAEQRPNVFDEMDRNQYETEQTMRNMYTA